MKFFSILTGILLATTLTITSTQAAFSDTANSPFKSAIDYVKAEGIVQGYQDGTYRPNQLINRAEFTKIVMGSLEATLEAGSNCFSDVPADQWFATYVCTAKTLNIINGNPDGTFKPAANINYAEAAKIVVEANSITTSPTSVWYERYLNALQSRNANLVGVTASSNITRGQMAQLIFALAGNTTEEKMMKEDTMMKDKTENVVDVADVSLNDGTTKLLFFNATWCPSCQADIDLLNGLSPQYSFNYPVVLVDFDTETSLRATYGVTTQHTYVLVDGQGNEIQKWIGPSDSEITELLTTPSAVSNSSEVTFDITGSNFAYNQENITVQKGDTVTINFNVSGGTHDFVIDELNVRSNVISGSQTDSITFVADTAGTFAFYCSIGNHRANGMEGWITVQ